ncbi:hypothetical protein [Phenylobacterium sp.]|uniref:hypothetical protein n=1 Tax=Phenylobacterium sp. TaxID=1871053 RepID=UPI002DEC658E|nr:hypothetical protein [Phenylobacterium sp.]
MKSLYSTWLGLTLDSWRLAAESQAVIGLRMVKLAAGDAASAKEAELMISEKVQAAAQVQSQFFADAVLGGGPAATRRALAHYRRKVRANRRRLSR